MKYRQFLRAFTALASGGVWAWVPNPKLRRVNLVGPDDKLVGPDDKQLASFVNRWCYPFGVTRPLGFWPMWERVA